MNLDFVNSIVNYIKSNNFVKNFINELQSCLENNNINIEREDIPLLNPIHNGNKIITKYRDKMFIEKNNILNDYAKQTLNKGEMYYIYGKNSKMVDSYNLCICKEENSHAIIEVDRSNLPNEAKIGSVLRKLGNSYILDAEATKKITQKINNMKDELLEEQTKFLKSKRVEGHIYQMSENDGDRAWLFDISNCSNESIEEINFPEQLLKNSKEGDLFIYKNGEYEKHIR